MSGKLTCLASDPDLGDVVYAGSAGGVWRTVDGGSSWRYAWRGDAVQTIGALAICAQHPSVVYAGTGIYVPDYGSQEAAGQGAYRSDDAGSSWKLLAPIPSMYCAGLVVHPADPDTVVAAGDAGIHRSSDGGQSWTTVANGLFSDLIMDPLDPAILYAGRWGAWPMKSIDGGLSWVSMSASPSSGGPGGWIRLNATSAPSHPPTPIVSPRHTHLIVKGGPNSGVISTSTDQGTTWAQLAIEDPWSEPYKAPYADCIALRPGDPSTIYVGGTGLRISRDGGATYTPGFASVHVDLHDVVFSAEDANVCYAATDGGMYRSEDGGHHWDFRSRGLITTQLYSVAVSDQGPFLLGGATQDVGIIFMDAPPHTRPTTLGPEGGIVIIDPNDSNTAFATPFFMPLARTTDRGATWDALRTGLPPMSTGGMPGEPGWVNHLAVQPENSRVVLAAVDNGIYKSSNQGDTWDLVQDVSPAYASRVAFSPKDPTVAYAADAYGMSLWRSDRSGDLGTWYSQALPHFGTISALAPDWNDPNILWVGYNYPAAGARIWRFDSGLPRWQQASGSPPNALVRPITSLIADQNNASTAYACCELGVFRTTDYGQSWQPLNDGLPSILTTQITLHRPTNTLYASTFGRGFWHRQL